MPQLGKACLLKTQTIVLLASWKSHLLPAEYESQTCVFRTSLSYVILVQASKI